MPQDVVEFVSTVDSGNARMMVKYLPPQWVKPLPPLPHSFRMPLYVLLLLFPFPQRVIPHPSNHIAMVFMGSFGTSTAGRFPVSFPFPGFRSSADSPLARASMRDGGRPSSSRLAGSKLDGV